MPLDILLLEVTGNFSLEKDDIVSVLIYFNILFLLFLAFVEQPLTSLRKVIVVQCISPFTLLSSEISTETVEELLDVLLVDLFVILVCFSIKGKLIEYNLKHLLIVLVFLLLGGGLITIIFFGLFLFFIVFLIITLLFLLW
jgi:hypothetical protein